MSHWENMSKYDSLHIWRKTFYIKVTKPLHMPPGRVSGQFANPYLGGWTSALRDLAYAFFNTIPQ